MSSVRVLALGLAIALLAACGSGASTPAPPTASAPTAPPVSPPIAAPTRAATAATPAGKLLPPNVGKTGAARGGSTTQFLIELENPNPDRDLGSVALQLRAFDPGGTLLFSQTVPAEALWAGQKTALVYAANVTATATIARVEAVPSATADSKSAEVKPLEVVSISPISQGSGNNDVIVEIRNPNPFDVLNVFVPALGYDASDALVAGGSLYVGFLRKNAVTPVRFFVTGSAAAKRWAAFPRPRGTSAYAPEPALRAAPDVTVSQATLLSYKTAGGAQKNVAVFQLQSAGQISVVAASDYQILAFDADKKLVAYKAGQPGAIFPGGWVWTVEDLVIPSGATPVSIVVNARPVRLAQAGEAKPLSATAGALPAAAPLRVLVGIKNPGALPASRTNIVVIGFDGAGKIVGAGKETLIGAIPPNESGEVAVVMDGPVRPARLEAFAALSGSVLK
ncbi:MAG: hypothetical protein ABIQ99_14050 [Thermoflexales bacterium]